MDAGDLDAKLGEIKGKVDELDGKRAAPKVGLDAGDLDAKADEARGKLDELSGKHAAAKIGLDTADFDAKLDAAKARLAEFRAESADARLGASGGAGGGGEGGGFGFPGGMLGGIAAGVAGLLPGLGGAATGMGLLGATGAMAFGGIGKALSSAHQASLNVGLTQQQLAATQFQNSTQIQSAQLAVGQAHRQAAQDAITSAQSIEQAQMGLAGVERNAAESQVQALHSVQQAQQGLQSADYQLGEAQYTLTQAWVQAREQITSLNDQLADSKLNVQSAQLAIQQALYQQRLTDQNAYSTQIEREQAALAVVRAQQQLKDAQDQLTNSQYAANLANKQGVAGSQLVIQAKQGVTAAQYAQTNAQFAAADAQRQLTLTQLNNAQQIKAAQMQLAAAEEQAAYQRTQDAIQVQTAQRNLTNTITAQRLQWAAMMSTENQAANQFAKDMSRLSPAAQNLVTQILGMRGAFRQMEAAAQNAVAPGLSAFLDGLKGSLPAIESGMSRMGTVIGDVFKHIGQALQTPAGAKVLTGLIDNGIQFAKIVIPAIGDFVGALAKVGSQKGAVDGIANVIGGLADGFAGLMKGLSPSIGALSSIFSTLGSALADIGQPLGEVIGALAQALAPALKALLPGFKALVDALGKGLSTALVALAPVMAPLATAISDIVVALAPLLPTFGQLIAQIAQALVPVLQDLVPIIQQVAQMMAQGLTRELLMLMQAIQPMLPQIANLIASFLPLVPVILQVSQVLTNLMLQFIGPIISALSTVETAVYQQAASWQRSFRQIEDAALWLWHNVLDPMWQGIERGAVWLYQNAILPLWHGIQTAFGWIETAAMWMWHNVFDPLWQGIKSGAQGFVSGFQTVWSTLEGIFKTPVNFLINPVYKNIRNLWDDVVNAIGMGSLQLPQISTFATGGVVAGYSPGRDTVPAMLSPGEGVLVPEAVRAIGPGTVHALNAVYGAGRRSDAHHFSGGGISGLLSGAMNTIASAGGSILSVGKLVADLASGNTSALMSMLDAKVGTSAAGNYARMMLGIPKTLIADAVKYLESMFTSGGKGGGVSVPGGVSGTVASWFARAVALTGVGSSWLPDLETIAHYESGDNPNAINLTDSNAAAGDPSRGLMQTIMSTFLAYHEPGTSMNIFDPVANIAAAINYIKARYGTVASVPGIRSLAHGGPYVGYDSGGWLMPSGMPVNGLAKPEAVLTPAESQAFVEIVRHLTSQGGGGAPLGHGPTIVQNYNGTQWPSAEQKANMLRDLGMAIGGG